jgi:hypothetical protein
VAALAAGLGLGVGRSEAAEGSLAGGVLAGLRGAFDFVPGPGAEGAFVLEDAARRVVHLRERGRSEPLPGLRAPRALALDEEGLLLVLDAEPVWTLVGFRGNREAWRVPLRGDLLPRSPVALAARNQVAWVLDRAPPRAFLFAYGGAGLGWSDLAGRARSPFSLALGTAGEAFVSDPLGPAVLRLSPTGTFLGFLSLGGSGVTRPTGLAVAGGGRVWVSDGVTGRLSCFDAAGGGRCRADMPRFEDPLRLAWAEGQLWVLEARPGRVRRLARESP